MKLSSQLLMSAASVIMLNARIIPYHVESLWLLSLTSLMPIAVLGVLGDSFILLLVTILLSFVPVIKTIGVTCCFSFAFAVLTLLIKRERFSLTLCVEGACVWTALVWCVVSASDSGSLIGLTGGLALLPWLIQPTRFIGFSGSECVLAILNYSLAGLVITGQSKYVKLVICVISIWCVSSLWLLHSRHDMSTSASEVTVGLVRSSDRQLRYELAAEAVKLGADVLVWLPGWRNSNRDCRASIADELHTLSVSLPIITDCEGLVFVADQGGVNLADASYHLPSKQVNIVFTHSKDLDDPSLISELLARRAIVLDYGNASTAAIVLRSIENRVGIVHVGMPSSITDASGTVVAQLDDTNSRGDLVIEQLRPTHGTWRLLHALVAPACIVYLFINIVRRRLLQPSQFNPPMRTSLRRRSLVSLIDEPLGI